MSQKFRNILNDIGNEAKRMGTQGSMELASALFSANNHGFVPYGPGAYLPSTDAVKIQAVDQAQPQIERGGREM